MRSHTITRTDDPDIHVVEAGPREGTPVLFLHGYLQCHRSWREQFRSGLADDHRLVAVDLRGHGDSGKPRGGYDDPAAWAGDVDAVIDALGLESAVLVGWSYGSLVALDHLAVGGTDRVAGVNLVGVVAGIGTETTTDWLGDEYVDLFPEITSTDAETSNTALSRFVETCVHGRPDPEDRYRMLGYGSVVPPRVRDAMRDRTVSHLDSLSDLDVPILLTHGAHDAVVAVEAARAVERRLPDAALSVYPDAGHSPFLESTERYNRELREFVGGLAPDG